MQIPLGRGSRSEHVFARLACPAGSRALQPPEPDDEDDAQITLWVLQQLSYRRIEGVDPRWEEDPSFLRVRHDLERQMELELREAVDLPQPDPEDVPAALTDLIAGAEGPSLSTWMLERGALDHLREFVVHRAAYQLQEADPHSFAIPRLEASPCKTALLQLQLDEYGGHEPTEAHALLFGKTMEALDLEPEVDLDRLPAVTLATNTLLNWLGRSRRLVGACLGHLAVFELTSVEPMARYAAAVRKLVSGEQGTAAARFYDVHVAADGLHGTIATDRLISGFVADHPDEAQDVLFGAAALLHVERRFAEHLVARWAVDQTSLREPLPGSELGQRLRRLAAVS
ncbi:MAG: iron-containing redox enzyme family protein [Actinomycetota bacterium]|nr:iron-containing redox enzyme family protein [Actinomycetota bacterium]